MFVLSKETLGFFFFSSQYLTQRLGFFYSSMVTIYFSADKVFFFFFCIIAVHVACETKSELHVPLSPKPRSFPNPELFFLGGFFLD